VAAALRDAGMEVIYTGLHQTPEQVVEAAVQEDVDVVALSILSGAHMTLFPDVFELMKQRGIGDRLLTGGGIIPPEDMESLARLGVGRLFGPGSSTQDIGEYIREWFVGVHGADALAPAPARRVDPTPVYGEGAHPQAMPRRAAPARAASSAPRRAAPARKAAATRGTKRAAARPSRGATSRKAKPSTSRARAKTSAGAKARAGAKTRATRGARGPARAKSAPRRAARPVRAKARPARRASATRRAGASRRGRARR
jgi:methylmalonyl-CoA mutase C-terminal domain/subunit